MFLEIFNFLFHLSRHFLRNWGLSGLFQFVKQSPQVTHF